MLNGEISNPVAIVLWLISTGPIGNWYRIRRKETDEVLYCEDGPRPTPDEAARIKRRLTRDAFVCFALWLGLFLVADWLF